MTRSIASRAVAVLILGAALSSGVLAAPTRSPMIPSSIAARDLVQSQSSSGGLGALSEGQTRQLATLSEREVPRQNVDGLTPFDDSKNGEDGADPSVSVSVGLEQRVDLVKRMKKFFSKKGRRPSDASTGQVEAPEVQNPGEGSEDVGDPGDLWVPDPNASEQTKARFFEDEKTITSWLTKLERKFISDDTEQRILLISRHVNTLNKLYLATNSLRDPFLNIGTGRIRGRFADVVEAEMIRTSDSFERMKGEWEGANTPWQRHGVFVNYHELFKYLYVLAHSALELKVITEEGFEPYKKIFDAWQTDFAFPDPLKKESFVTSFLAGLSV
ncbi:hypothetical protein FB446DRAFT_756598 [Lentinula raphanica]|nr:hypothetical protein FB446DRAFT_756598 [Lentinula raphanica]